MFFHPRARNILFPLHEYCQINGPCIVQDITDSWLDAFLTGVVKDRTVISRHRCLRILAKRDEAGQEGAMLWSVRCRVSITSELFHDVFWNGKVDVFLVVISFQVDAAIACPQGLQRCHKFLSRGRRRSIGGCLYQYT